MYTTVDTLFQQFNAEHQSNPLAKIIDCSFEIEVFPKELKTVKVIYLFTKKAYCRKL